MCVNIAKKQAGSRLFGPLSQQYFWQNEARPKSIYLDCLHFDLFLCHFLMECHVLYA